MLDRGHVIAALIATSMLMVASPAAAIDGEVLITHTKALNGNVTPGDAAGYPVTLSQTGSYKLASNLQVPADKNGIVATATEVSVDLNGFRISGGNVAANGIVGTQLGLTVRNGTINFFKGDGIQMRGALLLVEDMRIEETRGRGVYENGAGVGFARILKSTIFGNGRNGIFCGQGCHIEGNNISRNGTPGDYNGVHLISGTVLGNTIIGNFGYGIGVDLEAGFGNNTILGNSDATSGTLISLHPNACSPAC
jgi:hypothetical protein